ncbi:Transmembrane secretion effector [Thiothrix eikelboomii]|uniref:Transmembrane secretion effector n=1 Tax=Thiothrix eikelboomii TaxID=92487 RepID=A0A1T4VZQ5_9GAMM|nr:MFS transporter [Thiothrix eikelboomii]SKA70504.1 Transmembrane secretion effector [Thiothrix eikelboomii]
MSAVASKNIYRQVGFLPFVTSRLLSFFASQIQAIVVAWQVYDLTRDPMTLAYVGLAQFIPMLVLLIPAGDLIDRFDRKKIVMASWLLQAVCSSLLWLLSGWQINNPNFFYAVLVLYGSARAFTGPALQSLLPQVVAREQLAAAIAANSMLMRIAAISGPVLGGSLYALGGGVVTYAVCLVAFLAAALLMSVVPVLYAEKVEPTSLTISAWQRFTAGIQFIRSRPIILGTISLDLFAVLLGGVVALLPIYAQEVLHTDSTGLGLLRSAMALGEVIVGLYLSFYPFNQRVGMTMFIAVFIFGLANLLFALSTVFVLSLIALMIAGAADMVSVYIRSSLVQFSTPDTMRGRVNAVNMLFIGSSNELGEFRAGSSAAWLGVVPAAVVGSFFTLGITAAWIWAFPALRRVNKFEDATPKT